METELNWGNALVTGARKGCRAWNRYIELACGRSSSGSTSCSREPYRARLPRNKNWSFSNESHVLKRVSCSQTSLMFSNESRVFKRVSCFQTSLMFSNESHVFKRVSCSQTSLMFSNESRFKSSPIPSEYRVWILSRRFLSSLTSLVYQKPWVIRGVFTWLLFLSLVCDEGCRCENCFTTACYCTGDIKCCGTKSIAQGIQEW